MRFLHTMVRVKNLEESMNFYCDILGLVLVKKTDYEKHKFSLIYLSAPADATLRAKSCKMPVLLLTAHLEMATWHLSARQITYLLSYYKKVSI